MLPAVLIHACVVSVINIAAIAAGYVMCLALQPGSQVSFQVPAAGAISVVTTTAWFWAIRSLGDLEAPVRFRVIYAFTFPCAAAIFFCCHYIIRGYVTGWGNILALWAFQAPVNLAGLLAADIFTRRTRRG